MKRACLLPAVIVLLCLGSLVQADVFNLGSGLTNLVMVPVGDAGNAADTRYLSHGSVAYSYSIGMYEVTAAQYCDFLNHKANVSDHYGLYNTSMWADSSWGCHIQRSGIAGSFTYTVASDYANRPVNYISFWDACRFVNWLGNGQADGDTETGAYTLNGYYGEDGRGIERNTNCTWAVTSDDEWYKAAYYKGGGTDSGYWDYPTQSNSIDTSMANYNYTVGHTTDVGAYADASACGTYDQGGNVWEWNEAITYLDTDIIGRCMRGGDFGYVESLKASHRLGCSPTFEFSGGGFRVVAVPEPSSIIPLLGGVAGLLGIRRRKA